MTKVLPNVMNSGKVQSRTKNVGLRSDCGLKQMLGNVVGMPAPVVRVLLLTFGLEANKILLHLSIISSFSRAI